MASISNDPGGRRRLMFLDGSGKRQTIRLGKITAKAADSIKARVEHILERQAARLPLDVDAARWLADISSSLRDKFAKAGLIASHEAASNLTLGKFLTEYRESRTDVKASTLIVHGHTIRCLLKCFGTEKVLRSFTPADGDTFRAFLLSSVAENTARRRCGHAASFFNAAVRKGYLPKGFENPFTHLPSNVVENHARMRFVERADIDRVIAFLPDADWRCMIALARYGGLRCPSEPMALRQSDIDWQAKRIRVTVPKLSHMPNKATRVIPLFPELVKPLQDAIAASPNEFVIGNYRQHSNNFGTEFTRYVVAAGVKPWPKPFANLRATRETELADSFPIHVVCAWIGNSPDVAVKHYMQLRPHHFDQATGEAAARQASQQASVGSGMPSQASEALLSEVSPLPTLAKSHEATRWNASGVSGPGPTPAD